MFFLIFQVIIGGPLEEKIERIIKDRASVMNSPVISACDPGIQSILKCFAREDDEPRQTCDIVVDIQKDMKLVKFCSNFSSFGFGVGFVGELSSLWGEFFASTIAYMLKKRKN